MLLTLLYEAFKEVKETKAPAGFIYKDLVHYQLPLGGRVGNNGTMKASMRAKERVTMVGANK